ncbi:hypothetical protein CR203_14795 [Salipaludibacillus neizhouensis]|uniref:Uncharacterized protein n=1 Tax=Salipaludibacillus neizhouensis TaxID=885475 RepID=A0A3A9K0D3_9BACI|nr:hypothetical protein [Salipaludibacillus neizhouensis]RKL66554.1 hypothetical protein CR203_14795 [Salipaludibacillus neizhouensis]
MNEIAWDIREGKRLKKIQLVQSNLVTLLLFVLCAYFLKNGMEASFLFGICCAVFWLYLASMVYTLNTGRTIGTKTSRRVQDFDKDHFGEKRWKRKKIIEVVFSNVITVVFTVLLVNLDFNFERLDFQVIAIPFIGAWIGHNIGEIM